MIIGIDAGGTSTRAILYSNGHIIDSITAGTGNLKHLGMDHAIQHFVSIVSAILEKNSSKPSLIVIGVAGAGNKNDRIYLQEELSKRLQIPCQVETDAFIALYGAFDGKSGMILIAGTGSIAYGITEDQTEPVKVGGWGWQLGDEGSGVWLGREAIRCVLLAFDGRGEKTLLRDAILEKLQLKSELEIVSLIYSHEWRPSQFAELAPVVLSLVRQDYVSKKLVQLAASHLSRHLIVLQNQLGGAEKVKEVVFIGGLLENETPLRNELLIELNHFGTFQVRKALYPPEIGAARLGEKFIQKRLL